MHSLLSQRNRKKAAGKKKAVARALFLSKVKRNRLGDEDRRAWENGHSPLGFVR